MKQFGGREVRKPEQFQLVTVDNDGNQRTHQFQVLPALRAGQVVGLMDALKNTPEDSLGRITRMLASVLDDRDGVPATWQPPTLEDLGLAAKTKLEDVQWTGPDGETYTLADDVAIAKFLDTANGSSRRRWNALMDPDNITDGVMLEDLFEISEWVIGLATDRPTRARASSTGTRKTRR